MALMLLRTLFGTLQLIDRPDDILLRLRRVAGRAAIPVGPALYVSSILGFLKWIVSGVLVENIPIFQ
jgi:hypothetical protein